MEQTAIATTEPRNWLPTPAIAKQTMDDLQNVMQAVLDSSDYANIKGKKARKRSGFAKLRRVFSISIEELSAEWEDLDGGEFGYSVMVRASFPDGRHEDGDGYCDSIEMKSGNIAPSRHNVRAKAVTRAKNRATADLLGTGEVSAEEFGPDDYGRRRSASGPRWEVVEQEQAPAPANERPLDPEPLRKGMQAKARWFKDNGGYKRNVATEPITEKQIGFVASRIDALFDNISADLRDKARHDVLGYFYGVDSTKALMKGEASALIDWAEDVAAARQEAARILAELAKEAGQTEMELPL